MSVITYFLTISALLVVCFGDECTITKYADVSAVLESCTEIVIGDLTVPGGETLELNLQNGSRLTFTGLLTFELAYWEGYLVHITGEDIIVTGAPEHVIHGQGELYWDGLGEWGTMKPKLMRITAKDARFENINVKNCPKHCISISGCDHLTIDGWTVDVSDGDFNLGGFGHNTDGFGISSSTYVAIQNSKVYNQDDCVVVNSGDHVVVYNMYCFGGHGLSMSIGASKINDVIFLYSTVVDSLNAIHIKTHTDAGEGEVTDVIYSNIDFSGSINYGINIQEDYTDGSGTGIPLGNIPIKNLMFRNIEGTVRSSAVDVYILCGEGGCIDWEWIDVSVTGGQGNSCNYTPTGFDC